MYNLEEGVYTIVVCAAPQIAIPNPTRFVFQAIAENIQLSQLEKNDNFTVWKSWIEMVNLEFSLCETIYIW